MAWLYQQPLQVCCVYIILGLSCVNAAHYDDESSLRTAVLNAYEYKIRPSSTVTVSVKLSLLNINVLDVPTQRLSASGWLTFTWSDPRLTWTPSSYGGITDLYDTELVFWRPEIIVDNSISDLGILQDDKLLIRATYEGNLTWEPPGIFETHCDVDVTYYPFDTQTCRVEVTSWALTLAELDLQALESDINLADYRESGEWDVLNSWSERKELSDGTYTQSEIQFSLKVRRKPAYYVTTILIPVIVTSILCVLVFLLPAESGEKVGYSLTILLTYAVMLTLVASYMPASSKHTSALSVYLVIILFIGVFSTIFTVIVLLFHHHPEDEKIPNWLRQLTRVFLLPVAGWLSRDTKPENNLKTTEDDLPHASMPLKFHGQKVSPDLPLQEPEFTVEVRGTKGDAREKGDTGINEGRKRKQSYKNSGKEVREFTWQELALILDAACLRILGVFVFLLTIVVLLVMIIGGYTAS